MKDFFVVSAVATYNDSLASFLPAIYCLLRAYLYALLLYDDFDHISEESLRTYCACVVKYA